MKKTIIVYLIFILLGYLIGRMIFQEDSLINISKEKNKYYFIEEGEYTNDNIFDSITNIREKLLEYKNDKIYVYLAITKDLDVAKKITKIYESKNKKVVIKEKFIKNEELETNIYQFDLLARNSKTDDEILKIEEVVIASYKELSKR